MERIEKSILIRFLQIAAFQAIFHHVHFIKIDLFYSAFLYKKKSTFIDLKFQGASNVHVYFPQATWYSLIPINYGIVFTPGYHDVYAATDSLTPVFLRGYSLRNLEISFYFRWLHTSSTRSEHNDDGLEE